MNVLSDQELRRTARQLALPGFGIEQQTRLQQSHVLVIGAGGLGCPGMQSMAAAGIGRITVIDDDTVDLSNIHRQILFGAADQGRPKVEVAAERLRQLQPEIQVTPLMQRLTADNAVELFSGVDVVVDGSDTFATKYLAADTAEITGTPLLWGTVLRFAGQVALWDQSVGLRDLFPRQPDADSVPDCATAGVLGVTTAIVANLMGTEVVKLLSGVSPVQPGRVLSYDALTQTLRSFQVSADPQREKVRSLAAHAGVLPNPAPDPVAVELLAAARSGQIIAVDIRETHERLLADLMLPTPSHHLPLSELDAATAVRQIAALGHDRVMVYCASGVRSSQFVATHETSATAHGVELCSLPGGVNAHR